jgi:hypothetical protein
VPSGIAPASRDRASLSAPDRRGHLASGSW